MTLNTIYNENCIETLRKMDKHSIDIILTSPFYNTNKKAGNKRTLLNTKVKESNYEYLRYDVHIDNMTDEEYNDFTVQLFNGFDRVLVSNGVVLYNINYGSDNTEGMFKAINAILCETNFTIADVFSWKKTNALPNSVSTNKATRICEFVFVFCRREEFLTFSCNKEVVSTRENGQKQYAPFYNFIEAKNNDGSCPFNKATFSTELCEKLLNIYATHKGAVVYDPFMGSGTTALACKMMGLNYIGSEISKNQVQWANERISKGSKTVLKETSKTNEPLLDLFNTETLD